MNLFWTLSMAVLRWKKVWPRRLAALLFATALLALVNLADAQQGSKISRIGYLNPRSGPGAREEAFRQGLRDLGYIEGKNIVIEYRWAAGNYDRLPALAAELARLKVDVYVTAQRVPPWLRRKRAVPRPL
jgi:putative ABC transport system substrate-binding protein